MRTPTYAWRPTSEGYGPLREYFVRIARGRRTPSLPKHDIEDMYHNWLVHLHEHYLTIQQRTRFGTRMAVLKAEGRGKTVAVELAYDRSSFPDLSIVFRDAMRAIENFIQSAASHIRKRTTRERRIDSESVREHLEGLSYEEPAPTEPIPDALRLLSRELSKKELAELVRLKANGWSPSSRRSRVVQRLSSLAARLELAIRYFVAGTPVFVSSTYTDLLTHRSEVLFTLQKLASNGLPIIVYAMEYLGAGSGHPGHRCLELVRSSRVYIGMFARRYGSIWKSRQMSFTEAELRQAEAIGITRCIFVASPQHEAELPSDPTSLQRDKLKELRQELEEQYVVERFASPIELARKVAERMATIGNA